MKPKIINSISLQEVQYICLELLTTFHEICTKNDIIYWIDFGTLLGAYRHKGFIPWDNDIDICMPMEEYKRVIPLLKEHCNKKDNDHILFFGDTKVDYWYDYFGNTKFLANGIMPVKIDLFPAKIIENTPEAIAIDKSLTNIASAYILGKAMHPDDILQEHLHYIPDNNGNIIIRRHDFFEYYENYMMNNKTSDCIGKNYLLTYSDNDFLVKRERDYFLLDDIFPINKIEFEKKMFNAPANIEEHLKNLYGDFMKLPPEEQRTSSYAIIRENKKIPKKKIKNLIFMIYYHSAKIKKFDNLEKNNTNKPEKIKFFIKISLHLFFKFRIRSLRRFITYFILYHLPVTNKAHLDI